MKILLVITKAEIGGAQAFVLNLAKSLKLKGLEVAVAAGDGDYLPSELAKHNIDFFYLKSLKRSRNPLLVFSFVRELFSLLKKEKFTVLHLNSTNTLPGVIAACWLSKKIKTVFTVHGLSVLDKNYQANFFVKFLFKAYFKFFLKFVNKTVFVSDYNYKETKEVGIIKQGDVIYNGLDLDENNFLERNKAREELERMASVNLQNSFIIGSIGRLSKEKNYEFIINLWPLVKQIKPNAKLIIIGDGPEKEKYQKLIQKIQAGNDIFLLGAKEEASRLLKGFDLFILPSIYEGLSISLIETQFAGICALASDVGGNSEVIGEANCFDLNNKQEFLNKLGTGVIFQDRREKFHLNKMIADYIRVYE